MHPLDEGYAGKAIITAKNEGSEEKTLDFLIKSNGYKDKEIKSLQLERDELYRQNEALRRTLADRNYNSYEARKRVYVQAVEQILWTLDLTKNDL